MEPEAGLPRYPGMNDTTSKIALGLILAGLVASIGFTAWAWFLM